MVRLCELQSGAPLQTRDIAAACSVPLHYLEQIMVVLRRSGMVRSHRGASGGHSIARDPEQISVEAVLYELDGAAGLIPEELQGGPLAFYWEELEQGLKSILQCSLATLVRRQQKLRDSFMYTI